MGLMLAGLPLSSQEARLLDVRKIWDAAPHNAFTDLLRHEGKWYCVFREGKTHVSPDGRIRVLSSRDGETWQSEARISHEHGDLRDPKITVAPGGRLQLTAALAMNAPGGKMHRTFTWFSSGKDGTNWGLATPIGDTNMWLWRVTWNEGTAYSCGYDTGGEKFVRLYSSRDGKDFNVLVPSLFNEGYPNESSILFQADGTALCLLRRDGTPVTGLLGSAKRPYTEWQWKDLEQKIGGPHMIQLPNQKLVGVVRLYDKKVRTSVVSINAEDGRLKELLALPSGGDCSYAGIVWHDDRLWTSYYSSHEGKTSIYLARVALPQTL